MTVSVVMGVYNGEAALAESVESILNQTLRDFEFIIVNDGSTDGSQVLLEEYAARDSRIVLLHQENRGLTAALRRGCERARGKYIARQDAGDLSKPERLERQAAYLDDQPRVVVVCPFVELLGPGRELLDVLTFPEDPVEATRQWWEQRRAPVHTASMFRRDLYEQVGGYRTQFRTAQDHDLWYRLVSLGQIGYVPAPLFQWVLDETGISARGSVQQQQLSDIARQCHLARKAGQSETPWLEQAAALSQAKAIGSSSRSQNGEWTSYFVGTRLLARRDPRCRHYFRRTLELNRWHWKARLKLWESWWRVGGRRQIISASTLARQNLE